MTKKMASGKLAFGNYLVEEGKAMRTRSRLWWSSLALILIGTLLAACATPASAPPPIQQATTPAAAPTSAPAAANSQQPTTAPAASVASSAPAVPAGELRIGVGELGNEALDHILASVSGTPYMALIYDQLVGVTSGGQLSKETGLATDWQQSADKLVWTFKIRKGVKFQNGDELTAEDVKFSLERAIGPKSQLGHAGTLRTVIGSTAVPDPYTFVITTKAPYGTLPYLLSQAVGSHNGAVSPKAYVQKVGDDGFAAKPIGSGPYRVVSQQPGSKLVLEAMPNHWRIGVPKYKTITFSIIGEPTTLIASLKRGEQDLIAVPATQLKDVADFNIAEKKDGIQSGLYLHQQWEDVPYKDIRVRQALSEAIDRKAIIDTLSNGRGTSGWIGPVGGTWSLGLPTLAESPYNPEHAKQLLKDAGFAQGFDFDFWQMPRPGGYDLAKMAEMVVENWRAIGVRAKITKTDYPTFKPMWGGFKVPRSASLHSAPNSPMWEGGFYAVFHSKGPVSTVHDPKLDALIDKWLESPTLEDYAKGQGAAMQYVHDNILEIGLFSGGEFFATTAAFKGWDPGKLMTFVDYDSLIKRK